MNAEEYLRQVENLDRAIDRKLRSIAMWRDTATSISHDMSKVNYNPNRSTNAPFERCIEKANELEQEVTADIDRLADLKAEILLTLDKIDDVSGRLILKLRYIDLLPWEKIMDKVGYSRTAIHNHKQAALDELDKILKKVNTGEHK